MYPVSFETDTPKRGGSPQNWTQDPPHTNPLPTRTDTARAAIP